MAAFACIASGNWNDGPTTWGTAAGVYPGSNVAAGDTVTIGLLKDVTLNVSPPYTISTIAISGTTAHISVAGSYTLSLTGATGITVTSTNASGVFQVSSGTLTLTGACATVLLSCTAAGFGIVTSGTGAATLTNGTNAVVKNTSTGRCISHAVGTALALTGNIVTGSTTAAILVNHASATFTMTGTVSCATAAAHLAITFTNCTSAGITAPAGGSCITNASGNSVAGLVSIAAGTLTITGVAGATTAVTSTAVGYSLVSTGGHVTIANGVGTAISLAGAGRAVSMASGAGILTVTATTVISTTAASDGYAIYNASTGATHVITGNITDLGMGSAYVQTAAGTCTFTGLITATQPANSPIGYFCVYASAGTLNIVATDANGMFAGTKGKTSLLVDGTATVNLKGTVTLASDALIYMSAGTLRFGTDNAASKFTLNVSAGGSFVVVSSGGTLTANAGEFVLNQNTPTSLISFIGSAARPAVTGPTLPTAANVRISGSATYGFPGALWDGTAALSGMGPYPVSSKGIGPYAVEPVAVGPYSVY